LWHPRHRYSGPCANNVRHRPEEVVFIPVTPAVPADRTRSRGFVRAILVAAWFALIASCSSDTDGVRRQQPGDMPPAPIGAAMIGAYVPSGVWRDLAPLLELEAAVGRPFDVAHWFTSWDFEYDPVPVHAVLDAERHPLISWQPHRQSVRSIADGEHDDYIRSWADGVAAASGLVYIRPFPEMNGDWVSWNGDPDTLRAAWRRIAAIFDEAHASNVRWVFSPNVTDEPRTDANRLERYYPGHDVVDVLALSGYNWGTTREYIGWRSFEQIFDGAYERLTALGDQNVWLAEIASSEEGGDKAAWITAMLDSTAFDRVAAVVWFNEAKEADWRLESSEDSLAAFRAWFADGDAE
jgi:mannan endo-1,4-beta-mannosidase